MLDLRNEPDLGYIFYTYKTRDHPGAERLTVILRDAPTYRHFDPEQFRLPVATRRGDLDQLVVMHPWTQGEQYRVCAGQLRVSDRRLKRVSAFTFGGELYLFANKRRTICGLVSEAPIFPQLEPNSLTLWLASEMEIILARQKAGWDPDDRYGFARRLVTLDPYLLYVACLQAIAENGRRQAMQFSHSVTRAGHRWVRGEIERLQREKQWPADAPTLATLFG